MTADRPDEGTTGRRLVRRERLERRLRDGPSVVAVIGPAGTGKTTLVRSWYDRTPSGPRAWIDLSRQGPADAITLGRVLLTAAEQAGVAGARSLAGLLRGDGLQLGEDFLDDLAAALLATPAPAVIVMEDLHHLDPGLVEDLGRLAARMTAGPHRLVVTSRLGLPWPVDRWRAAGRLNIVSGDDLAFTATEVRRLFGRRADDAAVADLMAATRGWPAAVEAARWLLGQGRRADVASALPDLAGFVAREVLPELDAVEERVLCRASVLTVAPVPIAVAVTEEAGAGAVLRAVAHRTSLVKEVAPDELEVHPLLREALRRRLDEIEPGTEAHRHRLAAAAWTAADGGLDGVRHAMEHLLAARAWDEACALLEETWVLVFVESRMDLHVAWLDRIPAQHWQGRVDGALAYLIASVMTGQVDRGLARLARMPAASHPAVAPAVKVARAHGVWWTTPPDVALRLGAEGLAELQAVTNETDLPLLPVYADASQYETLTALSAGRAHALRGELEQARRVFRALCDDERALPMTQVASRATLVWLTALRGDLAAAEAEARAVMRLATEMGVDRSPGVALGPLALAVCAYLRGDLDEALAAVDQSAQTGRAMAAAHHLQVCQMVAALCGEPGRELGNEATPDVPVLPFVQRFVAAAEARALGRAGDVAGSYEALRATRPHALTLPLWTEVGLAHLGADRTARWLATQPDPSGPWATLARALSEAAVAEGPLRASWLDRAAEAMADTPLTGVLADAPQQVLDDPHPLLRQARAERERRDAARTPSLSARELELVRLLDSPAQVTELADLLYISPSTVKSHLRRIYRKLGVASRPDAVGRAAELGLLARATALRRSS